MAAQPQEANVSQSRELTLARFAILPAENAISTYSADELPEDNIIHL